MKKWLILAVVVAVGIIGSGVYLQTRPGKFDDFAKCLDDKGAIFYGAFWCPHCQNQKRLFGNSQKKLPYVECSTPDGKGRTQICIDKKIEGYPTWEFADQSRLSGEISLKELAEKTTCVLP